MPVIRHIYKMSSLSLSGKIAFVTGGGSGIGRATCQVLEREGAKVVVADINYASAQETLGTLKDPSQHLAVKVDVVDRASVTAGISAAKEKFKSPPTLIVNSAALNKPGETLSADLEQSMDILNVNVKGTFLVTQVAANAMLEHGSAGSVVNMSSIVGKMGHPNRPMYGSSKGAIMAFTKSTAHALTKQGIRVNCVLPGMIDTPMARSDVDPSQWDAVATGMVPLGRAGKPEEVGEVIAFLLSDRSSYMVGACVEVTGGIGM